MAYRLLSAAVYKPVDRTQPRLGPPFHLEEDKAGRWLRHHGTLLRQWRTGLGWTQISGCIGGPSRGW